MISHSTFLWDKSMYGIHHGEASLACKGEALMALVTATAAATTVPVSMTCILIHGVSSSFVSSRLGVSACILSISYRLSNV